jgi:hypothetical protein
MRFLRPVDRATGRSTLRWSFASVKRTVLLSPRPRGIGPNDRRDQLVCRFQLTNSAVRFASSKRKRFVSKRSVLSTRIDTHHAIFENASPDASGQPPQRGADRRRGDRSNKFRSVTRPVEMSPICERIGAGPPSSGNAVPASTRPAPPSLPSGSGTPGCAKTDAFWRPRSCFRASRKLASISRATNS